MTLRGLLNLRSGLYAISSNPKPFGPPISSPRAVDVHFSDAVISITTTGRP